MNKTIRTVSMMSILLFGLPLVEFMPQRAAAATDEEINALKQQSEEDHKLIQELLKQKDADRKRIEELEKRQGETEKKVGETQKTATETEKKVEETKKLADETAAKVPPTYPVPSEESKAQNNILLTGYTSALYSKTEGQNGSFVLGSFNPIFLYRAGDNLLFEGELEVEVGNAQGGGTATEIGLEYAQMDYFFNDYATVIAGKMLLPLGTFMEKIHPAWVNKLPNMPLPRMDEMAILPEGGVGLQLRGALPVYNGQTLTYSFYGVNGPGATDGTGAAGTLDLGGNVVDQNNAPSAGGRIGWFYPWKPYNDIELGVSGQSGAWNNGADLLWSALVFDAALHLGPNFEARGEYINTWEETSDMGTLQPHGWWAQAAYKLAGLNLDLPMVNNTELVFRYGMVDDDMPGTRTHEYTLGLVYYIKNTLQFKAAYSFVTSSMPAEANNHLDLQLAYGF